MAAVTREWTECNKCGRLLYRVIDGKWAHVLPALDEKHKPDPAEDKITRSTAQ